MSIIIVSSSSFLVLVSKEISERGKGARCFQNRSGRLCLFPLHHCPHAFVARKMNSFRPRVETSSPGDLQLARPLADQDLFKFKRAPRFTLCPAKLLFRTGYSRLFALDRTDEIENCTLARRSSASEDFPRIRLAVLKLRTSAQ